MPAPAPRTPPTPLTALASVAARLAAAAGVVSDVLPGVLETTCDATSARECTLWLRAPRAPHGFVRSAGVGESVIGVEDIARVVDGGEQSRPALPVVRLHAGGRTLGALALRVPRSLTRERATFLTAVADMLAPALSAAEHSLQLEREVRLRTEQIEDERRFVGKVVDSMPVGLYVIDREYRIQAWNRKRETGMQGVSREEAIGRTIFEILHRQPAEMLRREFDDVFASGRLQQFQMESSATGDLRTFRITKIPMRLDDAAVTHVITIGEDVTEWKDAEARFAQAEKLAAIGQLAAGVMHEINNPLATIAACAESMALRVDDDPTPHVRDFSEYLRLIDNEVHRCKRIVDGLLDFSRPGSGVRELVEVNAVVEQTLFLLKHHARFKQLSVHTALEPGLPPVHGNFEQLVQVLMALLLNAMDAMGDRGAVTVRTRAGRVASEGVMVEVIDGGHGIAHRDVPKIFEPFYTTKPPGRGTGLGLSICYGIIAEHGGRIEVDSLPGKGSTFRVVLPIASPTDDDALIGVQHTVSIA